MFHILMARFIIYHIKTYAIQEDLSNNIYHAMPCFNLFFDQTNVQGPSVEVD